jgi:hypothetical protein
MAHVDKGGPEHGELISGAQLASDMVECRGGSRCWVHGDISIKGLSEPDGFVVRESHRVPMTWR